jgi:hypothetical protein
MINKNLFTITYLQETPDDLINLVAGIKIYNGIKLILLNATIFSG